MVSIPAQHGRNLAVKYHQLGEFIGNIGRRAEFYALVADLLGEAELAAGLDEHLGDLPTGTFGRTFYDHYATNRYEFPGAEFALVEAWATPHDSLHVLSGYSTSAQGELLVAAFTGGMLAPPIDFMESHILPTILIYDGHPGGAGFAERGYRRIRPWLKATRETIESCECTSGCPSCIQSPKCGNGNEPLDKAGSIALLRHLLR